jgi:hypothetical protein
MLDSVQTVHYSVHSRRDCRRLLVTANSAFTPNVHRKTSGSGRSRNPFSERTSLAESFGIAAGKLESGVDRLLVDEYLRTAIATQPTSGQWENTIDKVLQTAASPDPIVFAKNLRLIAKGLKR